MPTRSYFFPTDFAHLEAILRAEPEGFSEEEAAKFRSLGLPPLRTVGSLPLFLGISPKTIFSIRRMPAKHYRSFSLSKKDGSTRHINTPKTYLKVIQWWILDNILSHVEIPENIFGFVPGRSAVLNANYHFGSRHILNVDIKQFFSSITIEQVCEIFCSLGYSHDVSVMLSELCCFNSHVPQGAPTSPAIANLVLRNLDERLSVTASSMDCRYSRYADDLTFSSNRRIPEVFLRSVEAEVERAGFALKPEKTRFLGPGNRMEVTGVVINDRMHPPRKWRKRTRATIHRMEHASRLTRRDVSYLFGIIGISKEFEGSPQMVNLAERASALIERKSHTVIGRGSRPSLPNKLTLKQAETLALLAPRRTNEEIASRLGVTESAVKKRLQQAFQKIDVSSRLQAMRWARQHL